MPIKREEIIGDCRLILGDNMPLMADMADNEFQLAIVDPPYGIGISANPVRQMHDKKQWDSAIPTAEYFYLIGNKARHQIIWGGNYFLDYLGNTQGFLVWDKKQPHDFSLAMCELAWTSLQKPAKMFSYSVLKEKGKIHPTQKPVALYRWLLKNYAKEGDHILDTHGGSMSSVIACIEMGFKITCIEIDEDYFEAGVERVRQHQRQGKLFQPPKQQPKPQGLF